MPALNTTKKSLLTELQSMTDECRMCQILRELPDSERDALLVVIKKMKEKNSSKEGRSKHNYTYRWLANTLTSHGFDIDLKGVRRFMSGKCKC